MANSALTCQCFDWKEGEEVCGSDGRTFYNSCHLFCEALYRRKDKPCLTVVHDGVCGTEKCDCKDTCKYVCGSNGESYGNECTLMCAQKRDPKITKVKDGMC